MTDLVRQSGRHADRVRDADGRARGTGTELADVVGRVRIAPRSLRAPDAMTLQRSVGNAATWRMLEPVLQASLHVGPAGDASEVEADRAADAVMRGTAPVVHGVRRSRAQRVSAGGRPWGSRAVGAAGGAVDPGLARHIDGARSTGRRLDNGVRRKMEAGFGGDFSGVRVHTGEQADQASRALSANAFTSGRDIFFARGQYDPASQRGQRLIAHELAHTVQQGATEGGGALQRDFHPAQVIHNAHLRASGELGKGIGGRIDKGAEIVVDRDDTEVEPDKKKPDTFVRAVDQRAATFEPAKHARATTYIREKRIGPDKDYGPDGLKVNTALHWPTTRSATPDSRTVRLKWLATVGEYVHVEKSASVDGATIVHVHGEYKRLETGALFDLDKTEERQLDTARLEAYLHKKVKIILRRATAGKAWRNKLATDDNVKKIMLDTGSKALRWKAFSSVTDDEYVSWLKWVTAPDGPLKRIEDGADHVAASIDHWRGQLYPTDVSRVTVKSLKLTGSDLHEEGLGVMFVTFNKPAGGHGDYAAAGDHEVVIKPEARALEQALFGTHADSLANTVNRVARITKVKDQLATYKQDVDARFGTLCEKVVGTAAEHLPESTDVARTVSRAMKEALVFIMLTGLSDQHKENVIWDDKHRPYMIDADNALKLRYMTTDTSLGDNGSAKPTSTHLQSGFTWAVGDKGDEVLQGVMSSSEHYETAIMRTLKDPKSREAKRLLLKVQEILGAQTGRTVPIETALWGQRLQTFVACSDPGRKTDAVIPGKRPATRWAWCKYWAATVPTGKGAFAPGLEGEVGTRSGTDGNFDADAEAAQLYADFKVGQIPFYNYAYGSGRVIHNKVHIWDGQPIEERMAELFKLFPTQEKP